MSRILQKWCPLLYIFQAWTDEDTRRLPQSPPTNTGWTSVLTISTSVLNSEFQIQTSASLERSYSQLPRDCWLTRMLSTFHSCLSIMREHICKVSPMHLLLHHHPPSVLGAAGSGDSPWYTEGPLEGPVTGCSYFPHSFSKHPFPWNQGWGDGVLSSSWIEGHNRMFLPSRPTVQHTVLHEPGHSIVQMNWDLRYSVSVLRVKVSVQYPRTYRRCKHLFIYLCKLEKTLEFVILYSQLRYHLPLIPQ